MSRLRHGYTNQTRRLPGGRIEKRYEGEGATERAEVEHLCLRGLRGLLPVPPVIELDPSGPALLIGEMPGTHGQDLLATGNAEEVMGLLGTLLAQLQAINPASLQALEGTGEVIVHGDFGPQNVLIDNGRTSALVDWEFAHVGQPAEDLAWAEWIIRMHHPDKLDALPALFDAANLHIGWTDRHEAMVATCRSLLRLATVGTSSEAAQLWQQRLRATERWTE